MSTPYPSTPTTVPGLTRGRVRARRWTYFSLVLGTVAVCTALLVRLLGHDRMDTLEWVMVAVYMPLVYQLACGFWLCMLGMWVGLTGDRLDLRRTLPPVEGDACPVGSPVAVVMPVYNEDVTRVFEGLRAMVLSLDRTGCLGNYDFFVLSDSDDPNKWIEEETAWMELCRQLDAYGKIFYRKRRLSLNKKSGNVADFCRRWGAKYRHMLVLDADSLMTGERIVEMTRIMEAHPNLGILQTAPKIVAADTLFGRLIQFAQAIYGDPFMRGLSWLQMGDATFWGHNAIIRLKPFIEHCALPELPGNSRILSHDFVEAALMRKAGLWVWLLPAEDGSWEETPPTFLDFLKRERRWCQGNLQHFWLLFAKGFKLQSRLHFLHGILGYVASPLWLAFLLTATGITRFAQHGHLDWHTRDAGRLLLVITLGLLFVPKIMVLLARLLSRRSREYGGRLRLLASGLLDTLLFTVLAPVAMMFRTKFVWATMAGQGVKWVAQRRKSGDGADWREAILTFGGVSLAGLGWAALAWWLSPVFLVWISPVLIGLALAIPFAILTSGNAMSGLFKTPDEVDPPPLLVNMNERLERARAQTPLHPELARHAGLMEALLDPYVNALHVSLLRQRASVPPKSKQYLEATLTKLMRQGPDALTKREIKALMYDPDVMLRLHFDLWSAGERDLAAWWTMAMREYNVVSSVPPTGLAG